MEREEIDPEKARMIQALGGEAVSMVGETDKAFNSAKDSKHYAGLMSLDEIKKKRARIESGEEFEDTAAKAVRQKRKDDIAAAKEEKAREARMLAKKEKLQAKDEAEDNSKSSGKDKKKKKKAAALSFDLDEEEQEDT